MEMAKLVATRATCPRKSVGAVLVNENNRVVSTGFNGVPVGQEHCTDVGCRLVEIDGRESCIATLHAESNALDDAGRNARGCTLYVTCTPCFECAKRIVNSGVKKIWFDEAYNSRKTEWTLNMFDDADIEWGQF